MKPRLRPLVFALVAVTAGSLWAQPPAPAAPPPAEPVPSPPPDYLYRAQGRRDPLVSTLDREADVRNAAIGHAGTRPEGTAGLQVAEITVRGIVHSRGAWMALVAGPDGRAYTLRAGDRLLNGTVRAVTAQAVVIRQNVSDSRSLGSEREVRKFLGGGD